LWAGNEPFVTEWVGPKNFGGSLLSLALAFNLIVNSWVLPNRTVLSSALVVRPQALSRITEAVLNLGLSVLLGHYFGLIGIVLGTALAGLLTSAWYLPLLTARLFGRSGLHFIREDAAPVLATGACLLPIAALAQVLGRELGGFLGAAAGAGLTGLVGAALLWVMALDGNLRKQLVAALGKLTGVSSRSAAAVASQI